MSAIPYAFEARANCAFDSIRKIPNRNVDFKGLYALSVPENHQLVIYKPILFTPLKCWSDQHHHAMCLAAVNAAIDAAELDADINHAFAARRRVTKNHHQLSANVATAKPDKRLALGKRYSRWTIVESERICHKRVKPVKVVGCQCDCGASHDVIADSLVNGRTHQCGRCARKKGATR